MLHWQQPLPWLLLLLGTVLAAVLAVTGSWKLFFAGAGGILVAGVIAQRPVLGLYLIAISVPLDAAGRIADLFEHINLSIVKLATLVTLGGWVLQLAQRKTAFDWPRGATLLCIYFTAGMMSLVDTQEFQLGYQGAIRFATTIVFYVLVCNLVRTRDQFKIAVALLAAVSVFGFGFAVAQRYLPGFTMEERIGWDEKGAQSFGVEKHKLDAGAHGTVARSSGLSYHAIIMAVNVDVVLPILFAAMLLSRGMWPRAFLWAAIGVSLVGILTTYSRTGLLMLFFSMGLIVYRRIFKVTPLHLAAALLVVVAAVPMLPDSLIDRVFSIKSYTASGSRSLRDRGDLLEAGLAIVSDHPVNGLGWETTYEIFDYYDYPDKSAIVTVHNTYLQVALELGIPGLMALLVFLVYTWRTFFRAAQNFRRQGDEKMAVLCEALLIGFSVWLVSGFTLDFMRIGFKNMWFLIAMAPALARISSELPEQPTLPERGEALA